MAKNKQPMQPVVLDDYSTIRFKPNVIVKRLLEDGPFDMNDIARWDVSREDREQFAQLIGYSVSGFSELSYVSDSTYAKAARLANPLQKKLQRKAKENK